MEAKIQALIDRFEIIDVLNAYCHGCDRLDEQRMASVYHADSWDDHGPNKMPGPKFAHVAIEHMAANTEMCSHQLGQSIVHITDDVAGAETYFIATLRRIEDGVEYLDQMGGRFVDLFERVHGAWKIKTRTCVHEWSIRLPHDRDWVSPGFVTGARSPDDPSYSVLGYSGVQRQPLS